MRQAVVNADDFGLCVETNQAIGLARTRGILTSASLMPNMSGFEHAVRTVIPRSQGLGVGIHFVLTSGRAVSDPARIPLLVDESGRFRRGFLGLLALTTGPGAAKAIAQIECELSAQLDKVCQAGIVIDHVNGHQHVHMIPAVWQTVVRVLTRVKFPVARLGPDPVRGRLLAAGLSGNVIKRGVLEMCALPARRLAAEPAGGGAVVRHPDRLVAALDRGGMRRPKLIRALTTLADGVTEILTHPSLATASSAGAAAGSMSREDVEFLSSPSRRLELEALVDPQVRSIVAEREIRLVSFGDLSRPALPAVGRGRR